MATIKRIEIKQPTLKGFEVTLSPREAALIYSILGFAMNSNTDIYDLYKDFEKGFNNKNPPDIGNIKLKDNYGKLLDKFLDFCET